MGCFSYICKKSGKAVHSSSFDGDPVHLFLLEDGKVLEYMYGKYDSYGRVFDKNGESFHWKKDWGECVDLHFSKNRRNGIAAILDRYFDENDPWPTERSEDDPDQGWGKNWEHMGSISTDIGADEVREPFHKTFYKEGQ